MKAFQTIRAAVHAPTKRKLAALKELWESWNSALRLPRNYHLLRKKTKLPSYYCNYIVWERIPHGSFPPVGLSKAAINLRRGGKLAPWFASIPTPAGRIRLPLRMAPAHIPLLDGCELADSMLVRRGERFFLHLVIAREVPVPSLPSHGPVLAIDLGERVIATSVMLTKESASEPRFHGRNVRGLRRHYAWLRTRLLERNLRRTVRRIGSREQRKVDDLLHKCAKGIVRKAVQAGAVIALGDLTGIQDRCGKSKRLRRIVGAMPFRRLTTLIEHKAVLEGVPVVYVNEGYSSQECHRCHELGKRPTQGVFLCKTCGEYNADINGAVNVGKRAMAYMAIAGAPRLEPVKRAPLLTPNRTG